MDIAVGLLLALIAALLFALSWATVSDPRQAASRTAGLMAEFGAALGNRYWRGRERGLRLLFGFILAAIGIAFLVSGAERIFGFGPR